MYFNLDIHLLPYFIAFYLKETTRVTKLKWEEIDDCKNEMKSIFIPERFEVVLHLEANMPWT